MTRGNLLQTMALQRKIDSKLMNLLRVFYIDIFEIYCWLLDKKCVLKSAMYYYFTFFRVLFKFCYALFSQMNLSIALADVKQGRPSFFWRQNPQKMTRWVTFPNGKIHYNWTMDNIRIVISSRDEKDNLENVIEFMRSFGWFFPLFSGTFGRCFLIAGQPRTTAKIFSRQKV